MSGMLDAILYSLANLKRVAEEAAMWKLKETGHG